MALSISSATNARDKSGLQKLKTDFNNDIEKVISRISGSKYDEMVRTIREYWVGTDADDFLSDIANTSDSLKKQIKSLKNQVEKTLQDDYDQFIKFQKRNIK